LADREYKVGLTRVLLLITISMKQKAHMLTKNIYLWYGYGRDRFMGVACS